MFTKIISGFSKYSHRSTIPSLLKDNRYTKKGYFKPSVSQKWHRKPSIGEDVPNAHLYYDYTKAKASYEANPKKHEIYSTNDLNVILQVLTNETYINKQDFKLLPALKLLNIHHPQEVKNNWEIFNRAYEIMLLNVRYMDIYNFRSFTIISQQYYLENKEVWLILFRNCIQFLVAWEHQQTPLLSKIIDKTQRDSFLFTFNIIMNQVRHFQIDISNVNIHLDYLMRNHLRYPKIHSEEIYNKIENIEDKNLLANFLSHFAFCIQQRKDLFNDVDIEVKEKQVTEFLHSGQKLLVGAKLTQQSKQNLLNSITNPRYIYLPLFEKLK